MTKVLFFLLVTSVSLSNLLANENSFLFNLPGKYSLSGCTFRSFNHQGIAYIVKLNSGKGVEVVIPGDAGIEMDLHYVFLTGTGSVENERRGDWGTYYFKSEWSTNEKQMTSSKKEYEKRFILGYKKILESTLSKKTSGPILEIVESDSNRLLCVLDKKI